MPWVYCVVTMRARFCCLSLSFLQLYISAEKGIVSCLYSCKLVWGTTSNTGIWKMRQKNFAWGGGDSFQTKPEVQTNRPTNLTTLVLYMWQNAIDQSFNENKYYNVHRCKGPIFSLHSIFHSDLPFCAFRHPSLYPLPPSEHSTRSLSW